MFLSKQSLNFSCEARAVAHPSFSVPRIAQNQSRRFSSEILAHVVRFCKVSGKSRWSHYVPIRTTLVDPTTYCHVYLYVYAILYNVIYGPFVFNWTEATHKKLPSYRKYHYNYVEKLFYFLYLFFIPTLTIPLFFNIIKFAI